MLKGRIVKNISNTYTVFSENHYYECTPRGLFRQKKITPLVGDIVNIDEKNLYILEILPRKNELKRPSVANVEKTLIVTSMKKPDFNSLLLDKEIGLSILSHIEPVLCFTKLDLLENREWVETLKKYYNSIGIPTFDNENLEKLVSYLKGSFVVLTGQSGAGKSTLLNRISPDLKLKTNEISESLNRGKHTTRHTEIFRAKEVLFCDTPGFSSLSFEEFTKEEIKEVFEEFKNYECKFRDCSHTKETVCGVKDAVSKGLILKPRYESYLKMRGECKK